MKIETSDKNGKKISLEIINQEIDLIIDDGESSISFLGDMDNVDFLISNLKKMSNKIKKESYECD